MTELACLHEHRKGGYDADGLPIEDCLDCYQRDYVRWWQGWDAAIATIRSVGHPVKFVRLGSSLSNDGSEVAVEPNYVRGDQATHLRVYLAVPADDNWAERIEIAKAAREGGRILREGKAKEQQ